MSLNTLYNGIGASLGDSLAMAKPLMLSGNVWYVSYARGTDAASPAGQNREKPLKTLQQALTNSVDGDIVVLLSDHVEVISTTVTVSTKVIIVGEGSAGGNPVASLTQGADVVMLQCATSRVELRNILFPEPALAVSARRVGVSAADQVISGCRFECGPHTGTAALLIAAGGDRLHIENTTFISTATSTGAQPAGAVNVSGAVADIVLDGVVFSDGTVGFSLIYAWDSSSNAITRLRATRLSLLLGADMKLHASTTGLVNVATATGGGKVVW